MKVFGVLFVVLGAVLVYIGFSGKTVGELITSE